jgi:mono/diheme cytochrome c family protein
MDFPLYHADFFGNRTVIGVIAVIHVIINHPFAVGIIPLITGLEWWGYRKNRPEWDVLAYKLLFVCFIITTTLGAMTGVGIWFSTAVISPFAIGSLLRVFYWAWFSEWVVFVSEILLIMAYTLTWKSMVGEKKIKHIRIGVTLSIMSWLTMAIIVAVLGYMMNPGDWLQEASLWSGFTNPIYLPQLFFRTTFAMAFAGSLALALTTAFTDKGSEFRGRAVRVFSGWTLFWLVPLLAWGAIYYDVIPQGMTGNLPVALGAQSFEAHFGLLTMILFGVVTATAALSIWGVWKPRSANAAIWVIPILLFTVMISYFERAREFIRKPYVIGYYMYSNGVRVDEMPYMLKTGLLANSVWVEHTEVTPENKVEAGRDIFMLACSRCHTLNGVNAVGDNLARMYPNQDTWDPKAIDEFLKGMHGARPFMPPFPGTPIEREALSEFLSTLKNTHYVAPPSSVAATSRYNR